MCYLTRVMSDCVGVTIFMLAYAITITPDKRATGLATLNTLSIDVAIFDVNEIESICELFHYTTPLVSTFGIIVSEV